MLLSRGSSSVCRLNSTSLRSFRTSSCIVTEQKNTTEQINVSDIPTEIVVNDNGSVAGFSPTQLNPNPSEVSPSKDKKKKSKRKSNKLVDPHEETKVDDHKRFVMNIRSFEQFNNI